MGVWVAGRLKNRHDPIFGHGGEPVRGTGGEARVHGDLNGTIGAILKTHRHGEPRGQFAMDLALRGPGADRAIGHQVGEVLRGDRVEEFGRGRQAPVGDIGKQTTREA